jgi:outer membrane protein assembly factor BamB
MQITILLATLILQCSLALGADNWPDFRGPAGSGSSDAVGLPLRWNETQSVKWKTAIHGRGWSSPVVWGKQVWLTTATEDGKEQYAVCLARTTGKVLYDIALFHNDKPPLIAPMNSYASPTPVVEEGRIYINFGSYGTACLDTATGETIWQRRDMPCDHSVGPGASPILAGKLLILPMDGKDVQYIIALDKTSGDTVWKMKRSTDYGDRRDEFRKAFSTPLLIDFQGKQQLICTGAVETIAYDPATGKELWKVRPDKDSYSNTSSPVFCAGMVIINTGASLQLWAVRPDGSGDVTESHVAWRLTKGVPFLPSPACGGELIYLVNDEGIASCVDAKSGKPVWQKRLGGKYVASPVAADGRVFLFSETGHATVIAAGRQYRELAVNELKDGCLASPAVSGKSIFVRTKTHVYRIEEPQGR